MPKLINEAAAEIWKQTSKVKAQFSSMSLEGRLNCRMSVLCSAPENSLQLWEGIKLPHLTQQHVGWWSSTHLMTSCSSGRFAQLGQVAAGPAMCTNDKMSFSSGWYWDQCQRCRCYLWKPFKQSAIAEKCWVIEIKSSCLCFTSVNGDLMLSLETKSELHMKSDIYNHKLITKHKRKEKSGM